MGTGPDFVVPVVEGPQAGQTQILVLRPGVDRPAEARDQRGEAERGPDAGQVHVGHPLVDVEAPGPHLVESSGLHAPLGPGAPDYGVEADVGVPVRLEDPALGAGRILDDAGRLLLQGGGQSAFEQIGWLNEMVVDRDDGHPDRPRLGVWQQRGGARRVQGVHELMTLPPSCSFSRNARPNRCRAKGTHTTMISAHQPIMAATGWSSCHEPAMIVPGLTWRTAATSADSGSHSAIARGISFIPEIGHKRAGQKRQRQHDRKADSLHGVGVADQHPHEHPEPGEGEQSQQHQGHQFRDPSRPEVRTPAQGQAEPGHDHNAKDLLDDLADDLG